MNTRLKRIPAVLAFGALLVVNQASGHHGMDAYDTQNPVDLTGTVVGFELLDPHSMLYVDVKNADGSVTSWVVEGGAAHGVVRVGLTKESLANGPGVIVRGYQSSDKQCDPGCKAIGRDFLFE